MSLELIAPLVQHGAKKVSESPTISPLILKPPLERGLPSARASPLGGVLTTTPASTEAPHSPSAAPPKVPHPPVPH
jgi:hypothetical protein